MHSLLLSDAAAEPRSVFTAYWYTGSKKAKDDALPELEGTDREIVMLFFVRSLLVSAVNFRIRIRCEGPADLCMLLAAWRGIQIWI